MTDPDKLEGPGLAVHVVCGEKFELSEAGSRLLGDFWDRQKSTNRPNYLFTDAPTGER